MSTQFLRKGTLVVVEGTKGLDLSTFHFTFQTAAADVPSPANCVIRVFNLSESDIKNVREFTRVVLQAGYADSFGVIFDGTIKQFRIGRQNNTDSYLEILAADGDKAYNYSTINTTLAGGANGPADVTKAAIKAMSVNGVGEGHIMSMTGGVLPRGKVLFGMPRAILRQVAAQQKASWSISNGKVNVTAIDSYLPGEALVLNAQTGMVGVPEQTEDGVSVQCLINPRLVVGGLVKIDNKSINKTVQAKGVAERLPYNSYGIQNLATIANDGIYRVFVIEHDGDSRGGPWYSRIVCLAVDPDTKKVKSQ